MNGRRRGRAERRVPRRTDFTFSLPFLYQISWCCGRGRPDPGKTLPFLYLFHTKIHFEWCSVRAHAFGGGRVPFFPRRFQLDGLRVLNLELVLATPVSQRGFGDVEFGHQAGVSPALGAELDETQINFW